MKSELSELKLALRAFLEKLPFAVIAHEVSKSTGKPEKEISDLLDTYANESFISLELAAPRLCDNKQMLEVGAGLCLLSLFLKQQGYSITALEPAIGGYGIFAQTLDAILKHCSELQLKVLTIPAQELNPKEHGKFDLIFSNNVMEHIPDWPAAISAMAGVLSDEGAMVHSCPNYTVPYEPHYGIPTFRHFRKLSARLFLSETADTEIWDSLNLITAHQVNTCCKRLQLTCDFKPELLYKAFQRVHDDPLFQHRHKGVISMVASLAVKAPFRQMIRAIPPSFSTPMTFEIRHSETS